MNAMQETDSYLQKIRHALDVSAIVAITDPQGNIIEVNDKFCEISKYSREDLLGKNHRIINSGTHSKEFFRDLWKAILNGQKWEGEICNRAKDGSYYWVHTHIIPIKDGQGVIQEFVSIRYDITSRKRTEQNLSSLLDSHLDALFIYDLSGNICWHNATAQQMFPDYNEFNGQAIETILGPEFAIFQVGEGRITKGYDDTAKSFELIAKNYNFLSRAAYLVSLRDVTEKTRSEARLIQQERLASIGVMASGLAHEIGTPLGVIRGRAEIIASTPGVVESARSGAETIMQQIDRVSYLVKSLLKLARGEESSVLQDVHLVSLFADIYDFIHYELEKQDIQMDLKVEESFEIKAVYTSLFQVFLNLFVNATHAIQEHRKRQKSSIPGLITVTAVKNEDYLVVRVCDNGCGMDDDEMRKLFTPFFTTKEVGQGTGLGLATSYKLLQSWGGFMSVSSALEAGSTFEVHLPLR